MNTSKSLINRLVLLACMLTLAPAAEAQAWSDGTPAAVSTQTRSASLPATRYGLLAPVSGNLSNSNSGGYALPSAQLPYSATNAMSINVCDDDPVISADGIEFPDDAAPEMYPAPRTQGGVK